MNTMRPWPEALEEYLADQLRRPRADRRTDRLTSTRPAVRTSRHPPEESTMSTLAVPEPGRPAARRRRAPTPVRWPSSSRSRRPAVGAVRRDPLEIPIIVQRRQRRQAVARRRATTSATTTTPPSGRTAGEHFAAMPHKSAASRNVGHYIAYREGFDVIVALDYDCGPAPGWLDAHLAALSKVVEAPALAPGDRRTAGSTRSPDLRRRAPCTPGATPTSCARPSCPAVEATTRHRRGQDQHGRLGRHPRPQRDRQVLRRRARRSRLSPRAPTGSRWATSRSAA